MDIIQQSLEAKQSLVEELVLPKTLGISVRCCKCPAFLEDPDFDDRGVKEIGERFGVLAMLANRAGWAYEVVDGDARFICPACIARPKQLLTMALPRYDFSSPCPKCGLSGISASSKFCTGRTGCGFGAPREHIHRTCGRCKHDWVQACIDDENVIKPPEVKPVKRGFFRAWSTAFRR
jgi:hypothetical protein